MRSSRCMRSIVVFRHRLGDSHLPLEPERLTMRGATTRPDPAFLDALLDAFLDGELPNLRLGAAAIGDDDRLARSSALEVVRQLRFELTYPHSCSHVIVHCSHVNRLMWSRPRLRGLARSG